MALRMVALVRAKDGSWFARKGIPEDVRDPYALFVDAVSDNLLLAITLLERRAHGDYSPDETPESFPAFTEGPIRASGVSCWDLFEAFVKATKPADTTVSRWRAVFLEMQREFTEVGAEGITEDKACAWVLGLIS